MGPVVRAAAAARLPALPHAFRGVTGIPYKHARIEISVLVTTAASPRISPVDGQVLLYLFDEFCCQEAFLGLTGCCTRLRHRSMSSNSAFGLRGMVNVDENHISFLGNEKFRLPITVSFIVYF